MQLVSQDLLKITHNSSLEILKKKLDEQKKRFESLVSSKLFNAFDNTVTPLPRLDISIPSPSFISISPSLFGQHPLKKLANALEPYEGDMGKTAQNLRELKGALTNFEMPPNHVGQSLEIYKSI